MSGEQGTLPGTEAPPPAPHVNGSAVEVDSLGRPFDPAKFKPEKDSIGRWKNLRGGRNPGSGPKGPETPKDAAPAASAPDFSDVAKLLEAPVPSPAGESGPMKADEYTAAAAATVAGVTTVAILAMGAHVKPSQDQATAMVQAYADCYRAYGYAPKTPPWLGPILATGVWLGPHIADKRSQDKLQGWKARIAPLVLWFRGLRERRAAVSAAQTAQSVR